MLTSVAVDKAPILVFQQWRVTNVNFASKEMTLNVAFLPKNCVNVYVKIKQTPLPSKQSEADNNNKKKALKQN